MIQSSIDDGAAWIRINRPERSNAFTPETYGQLRDAVRAAELDDAVDVIVITGVGKAFATGGDVDALSDAISSESPLAIFEFENNFPFDAIRDCDKATIAAVNGMCLGGGMIIAGLCDLVVAAESATFSIPEGLVGIAEPFAPTALFTKLPTTQIKYLAFTGERLSAEEACRLGLVTSVAADDALEDATRKLVDAVRRTTPTARRFYKHYINDLLPRARTKDIYPAMLSPEGRAAMTAFVERRGSRQ